MKKILISFLLLAFTFGLRANKINAEILSYPFDSITITEASKFEIVIPSNFSTNSLLSGLVTEGEIITVYIGFITMVEENSQNSSRSTVLIMTNDQDEDIVQFLVNNYLYVEGVKKEYGFASHILIDPEVGVYKDMDLVDAMREIDVIHSLNDSTFLVRDDAGLEIPMVEGSYELQTGLSIVISASGGMQ